MAGFESFPVTGNGNEGVEDDAGEGWQDIEEYQREQSIEIGEIGPRETGIGQEARRPLDKEARKREKKERLKRERVARKLAEHSK